MKIVSKLVLAEMARHPARAVLTTLAVVAASCVVVWVVSGYDALLAGFDDFSEEYLGRYQVVVVPKSTKKVFSPGGPSGPSLPNELVTMLKQDPAVATLDPLVQFRVSVARDGPPGHRLGPRKPGGVKPSEPNRAGPHDGRRSPRQTLGRAAPGKAGSHAGGARPRGLWRPRPTLVGTDAKQPPYPMVEGEWLRGDQSARMEGVLDSGSAKGLEIQVGDEILVESKAGKFPLKIIGIVEQISIRGGGGKSHRRMGPSRGPATSALYVPTAWAEKIAGEPARINCINVALKKGTPVETFCKSWAARLEAVSAEMLAPGDVEADLKAGRAAANVRKQAYAATGISLLAALFIILTTLSMGVHERSRQLAVLRAVALTRRQVAAMIALESLYLAVFGWLGGLAAGWGLLWIMARAQPELFRSGVSLGTWAVALSGACAFGGALIAAILPAWRATRISPLEAMTPRTTARPVSLSLWAVGVGLVLIAVNPLLVFVIPIEDASRYAVHAAVGCGAMAVGFLLLTPLFMLVAERVLGPVVAALLRLDGRLLRAQLTGNQWRTLGTTVALSLGLGLYVAMQVWGYTMLGPFVPGTWVPDALVAFQYGGLPDEEIETIRQLPGVTTRQCLPLAVEQPALAEDITGSAERTSVTRQDNVILVGLDPEAGLGGDDPLLNLTFVAGNRADAAAKMKQGRFCVVPDHFAEATGLGPGDRFTLVPPEAPETTVDYAIAGVVKLPGWHWMTKFSGLRRRGGRTAALIFAPFEEVRRDFNLEKLNFVWMNLGEGTSVEQLGKALEPIAERNWGEKQPVNGQGAWAFAARMFGASVRITTAEDVRGRIGNRADGMIWGMCQLPLITLLVTSLGMVNAVMASIRARRWEMGVLRATGLTRFGLFRLILAEALLIGLVACLLSLGFGVMAGWCGAGISQYVSFFGGLHPTLVVPWSKLMFGFSATLILCLAAALWPAGATGRTEPLRLLQLGRAAM